MIQYHQSTVLPNFNFLQEACKLFYQATQLESYYSQLQLDMIDSRLRTIEPRLGSKSILLKGLPAVGFRTNLEYHFKYWAQQAGVSYDLVSSFTNHMYDSDSSILRLEFLTESAKVSFSKYLKDNKCEWNINYNKTKCKQEPDLSTSDRLAKQPYYTLLELLPSVLPQNVRSSRTTPK